MVWGAISYDWKSPLVFLEGTGTKGVTAIDYYEQILEPIVAPAFHGLLGYTPNGLCVEDCAPIHGTRKRLVEAKRILGIPLHERPPNSPDLNPIENVWRLMKQRIKARASCPSTLEGMKVAVQEEWDKLEPADWNKYILVSTLRSFKFLPFLMLEERPGSRTSSDSSSSCSHSFS
jgi:transposase